MLYTTVVHFLLNIVKLAHWNMRDYTVQRFRLCGLNKDTYCTVIKIERRSLLYVAFFKQVFILYIAFGNTILVGTLFYRHEATAK